MELRQRISLSREIKSITGTHRFTHTKSPGFPIYLRHFLIPPLLPVSSFPGFQVGDGHAASSETRTAGGADRRRRFATELRKILESGRDVVAPGSKGGRTGLIEVASGAVGVLSRACIGEMQVLASRT